MPHLSVIIYIWIPHHRDPGGWNFVIYREVLLVFWCTFTVLGDFAFLEVKEGLLSWRMMLGQGCSWL